MCYQKFHICKYCKDSYPCEEDNYTCATINHDANRNLCPACMKRLADKLDNIINDDVDLRDIDIEELLK